MDEPLEVIEHIPDHGPSPFDGARRASRKRRMKQLSITLWGVLLAAAALVTAAIGWTPLGGENLLLAQLLSVLFGAMAATALVGRLVIDPA